MEFELSDWGAEKILDSRDIISRIDDLESAESDVTEATEELAEIEESEPSATAAQIAEAREARDDAADAFPAEDREELETLRGIASDGNYGDWDHGATLILDSHFSDYAREFAADIGAISADAHWPLCHIDWDAAADALKTDYIEIEAEGETYFMCA